MVAKSTARTVHDIADRFWARVKKAPKGSKGCWVWMGSTNKGYGQIGCNGFSKRPLATHRVSWELHYGPIPKGKHVLHSCDNRPCVRPDHLFLGNQVINNADRKAKGRTAVGDRHGSRTQRATNYFVRTHGAGCHGEKNGNAKLSDADVALLRQQWAAGKYRNRRAAARAFGISGTHAGHILSGKKR